jgi:hypothetical protein
MTTFHDACPRCGRSDGTHEWVEQDCVLPHHAQHTRARIGHVCRDCVTRHRHWLNETLTLYAGLQEILYTASNGGGGGMRHQKLSETPSPLRLEAWALLFDTAHMHATDAPYSEELPDIPAVLCSWAGWAYEAAGYGHDGAPSTLSGAVALLVIQAADVARQPWVDEYDTELGWCRSTLLRTYGKSDRRPVGRCPSLDGDGQECGGQLWQAGGVSVRCDRCRRFFGERFLRHLGGMMTA